MKSIWSNLSAGFVKIKTPTMLLFILGLALVFVWQRAYTIHLSGRITHLENNLLQLKAGNSTKIIRIASLSSPERIEALAQQMCNLRYSQPQERVCVQINRHAGTETQSNIGKSVFTIRNFVRQQWEKIVSAPLDKSWELHQRSL